MAGDQPAHSIRACAELFKSVVRACGTLAITAALFWNDACALESGIGKEPGRRLLQVCELAVIWNGFGLGGSAEEAEASACLAFIDGFVWGHAWASWREGRDMWFCLPGDFTAARGVKDVVRYLNTHPDRLDEESHLLVFLALTAAYPCKPPPR